MNLPAPVSASICEKCSFTHSPSLPLNKEQFNKCLEQCPSCSIYDVQINHPIQLLPNTPLRVKVTLNAVTRYKFVKILTRSGYLEVPQVLGEKKTNVVLKKAEENGEITFEIKNLSLHPKTLLKGDYVGEAQIVHNRIVYCTKP